jgi:MerR HTH family regulatory protein
VVVWCRLGSFYRMQAIRKRRVTRRPLRMPLNAGIPRGWIPLASLLAETGIDERTLNNWRQRRLIPRPQVLPIPEGRGSVAYYSPETVTIIHRLRQLRSEVRNSDEWLWRLWLEGHPVEMQGWAADRIGEWKAVLDAMTAGGKELTGAQVRKIGSEIAAKAGARSRVRNVEKLADLADWALGAASGGVDAIPNDPEGPPIFDTLRKFGGLPTTAAFPLPDLLELSLDRLAEIIAEATEDEVEQSRRDWQAIARLAIAAEGVDWNATRPVIEPAIAKVSGKKREPKSWRDRRARRARPLPAPNIIEFLVTIWRVYDIRALLLASLIGTRRSAAHSERITEVLALAEGALSLFPRSPRNSAATP